GEQSTSTTHDQESRHPRLLSTYRDTMSYLLVASPGHGVVGHHPSPPRRVPIGRLPVAGFGVAAGHLFLQHLTRAARDPGPPPDDLLGSHPPRAPRSGGYRAPSPSTDRPTERDHDRGTAERPARAAGGYGPPRQRRRNRPLNHADRWTYE